MSAARIGKIKLKSGGAEVRLLRTERPNASGQENWAGKLTAAARASAEHVPENGPITGYVMVAFYADGSTYASFRWGDESPMNRCFLPAYITEIVRREVVTEAAAAEIATDVVNRANGFEV